MDKQLPGVTSTKGLPVSPSLGPTLESAQITLHSPIIDQRILRLCLLAIGLALLTTTVAFGLVKLILLITNFSFWGRLSFSEAIPSPNHYGYFMILIPVVGGVIVGLMARYGSPAIRGHGIPEAMEQVLTNESRIPLKMTFLKPLSAAISIGTGGPFGAEGPIIATGGALGSLLGQVLHTTATERKVLLGAGAAAGMTAIFGSPVSAVLLVIELLLFEYRIRSLVPVCLAAITAAGARVIFFGFAPVFLMHSVTPIGGWATFYFIIEGAVIGIAAYLVTKLVYGIENLFEHLPIHWMWWPAMGGVVVGIIGYFFPNTLGVGYSNIDQLISGTMPLQLVIVFCITKLMSWSVALGSGTSGGTLAPLLSIGGAIGGLFGILSNQVGILPHIDIGIAALVGAAALFAGASRALLASVIFALEATHQYAGLFPLLTGCTSAFVVSCLLMRNSIMTEKIVRRGVRVPSDLMPDYFQHLRVGDYASSTLVTLPANLSVTETLDLLIKEPTQYPYQGFPIASEQGKIEGVITRRNLLVKDKDLSLKKLLSCPPIFISKTDTLRDAANLMSRFKVGRLLVTNDTKTKFCAIITRSDLLRATQSSSG